MAIGKDIVQKLKNKDPTNDYEFHDYYERELMLWQDPDLHCFNIAHAIAFFENGIEVFDLLINCKHFPMKNQILSFFIQSLEDRGNSCLHLASQRGNHEFLNRILSDEVRDK